VKKYQNCISHYVKEDLGNDWKVTNYAADGFTTSDVLNGAIPSISMSQRAKCDPFPTGLNFFAPLEQLEALHKKSPVSHVVLSVGGNDIRVILHKIQNLLAVLPKFVSNYEEIMKRLLKITPNVIIMTQYRPSFHQDNIYHVYSAINSIPFLPGNSIEKLNGLMGIMYGKVFQYAQENKLAVIDLSNTFEPRYSKLFECQIEPSQYGSQLTSKLITHVLQSHNWNSPSFSVIWCPPSEYDLIDDKLVVFSIKNKGSIDGQWKVEDDLAGLLDENIEKWGYEPNRFGYHHDDDDDDKKGDEKDKDDLSVYSVALQELKDMGFTDRDLCLGLLMEHDGDVNQVIEILISSSH